MNIENFVRPNILRLKPYSSARSEFSSSDGIFLDANENPFGTFNRYPDPNQTELKKKLSFIKNIPTENIFVGNGSDEVIDLALRIFCNPREDSVIICPPTYGMYEVCANINEVKTINIPLEKNHQLDMETILRTPAKMIFLCSPNNPTGNVLKQVDVILKQFQGIAFIDEAYIDFSESESWLRKIYEYPNLIVSQTLSKAWGQAAIRIGIAFANKEIISLYNKIKPPYNVSKLNQEEALTALNGLEEYSQNIQLLLGERDRVVEELNKSSVVKHIFPSDANFILVQVSDANAIYQQLIEQNIIVRNRHSVADDCLRITIGNPDQNTQLIKAFNNLNP